jgi:hypothetical protein
MRLACADSEDVEQQRQTSTAIASLPAVLDGLSATISEI